MTDCPCTCHAGGPFARCSIDGGCWREHPRAVCRRGLGCAGKDREGRPAEAEQGICQRCATRLTSALPEFPGLYVRLWQALPAGGAGGEKVSGSKSAPLPLRVDVQALMSDLVRVCCYWEAWVRRAGDLSRRETRRVRSGPNLTAAVTLLSAHTATLLELRGRIVVDRNRWLLSDGSQAAIELLDVHRGIRKTLGLGRLTHRLPEPCWYCEVRAVVRESGSDIVHCENCRKTWTIKEYETLVGAWAHLLRKEGA